MNYENWLVPQYIIITYYLILLLIVLKKDDLPKYNIKLQTATTLIILFVLYLGGFFE